MKEPFVSIITPVFNSENYLEDLIKSINNLDYPKNKLEAIMVIDKNSNKESRALLKKLKKKYKFLKIVENNKGGSAANRNKGFQNSKGEFLAFTDSDCIVHKNWLKILVNKIQTKDANIVGGINLVPKEDNQVSKSVATLEQTFFGGAGTAQGSLFKDNTYVNSIPNCNALYKRELWEKNKQNESLIVGQDGEFNYRLKKKGNKFLIASKAIVYHHRENSIKKFAKKMYKYGIATSRITKIHKETAFVRWYSFLLLIGLLVFIISIILSFKSIIATKLTLLLIIIYLGVHIITMIDSFLKSKKFYPLIPLLLLTQHIFYSLGLIKGIFK